MNIIHKENKIIAPFQDDANILYAAKHVNESGLQFHGGVTCDHYRDSKLIHTQFGSNTFTTEGMARLLNIMFGDVTKAASAIFYVGIFKNNVTPGLTDTAAAKLGASGSYGECQDVDYSTPLTDKPSYVIVATSSASCTNAAAPASFTIAGGASFTVYGAFLSTVAVKTATTGYLTAAKKFGTSRAVIAADVLAITYVISASTS